MTRLAGLVSEFAANHAVADRTTRTTSKVRSFCIKCYWSFVTLWPPAVDFSGMAGEIMQGVACAVGIVPDGVLLSRTGPRTFGDDRCCVCAEGF